MGFWDSAEGRDYARRHAGQLKGSTPQPAPKKGLFDQVLDGDKDVIEAIGEAVFDGDPVTSSKQPGERGADDA